MATYHASKAYVFRLSESIWRELRHVKSGVSISCLCPAPTGTGFFDRANVKFNTKIADTRKVARYGIDKMLKKKFIILPGIFPKLTRFLCKIIPDRIIGKITFNIKKRRN